MHGQVFDEEAQIRFQTLLIQHRLYRPNDSAARRRIDSIEEITFEEARQIFEDQDYEDPPMRGRTSFAPLRKMGLCTGNSEEAIAMTEFGTRLLEESNPRHLFLQYFLKWQHSNPLEREFNGFCIKPFVATLHLINEVNNICKAEGENPVGISKQEFNLFVPTLSDYRDIQSQAERVIRFRRMSSEGKEDYKREFTREFLGLDGDDPDRDAARIESTIKNLRDYGDNAIRYFRMTGYIRIRGNGYYIDLENVRRVEIEYILDIDNAAARMSDAEYLERIGDPNEPELPWEGQEFLEKVNAVLIEEINSIQNEADPNTLPPTPRIPEDMRQGNQILRDHIVELKKTLQHIRMRDVQNISDCITELHNMNCSQRGTNRGLDLERQVTLALVALNDGIISPNYPLGDDGEPTSTAPGGMPDIVCHYSEFSLTCEVTMIRDRSQWVAEGQPVMRHLRDFEESEDNDHQDETYCLFIAPVLHRDTINTFWSSVKHNYEGMPQKIIPITIDTFIIILNTLMEYRRQNPNQVLSHRQFRRLYNDITNVRNIDSSIDWSDGIPDQIARWAERVLA